MCEDFDMKSDETPPKTTDDKILKEVQTKEVTSQVEASKNAHPQLETVCVKFNRTSKHWEQMSYLQEFVKKRHSSMK